MIPLSVPNLAGNEAEYLQECISSTFVSSVGPFVDRFEQMVARVAGSDHAVAASSGTTALHLALTVAGVGRDDLVVLPSFTFIASANAISLCGADPWLLDIEPDSWTLDPTGLEQALSSGTSLESGRLVHKATGRRVAAVMPVYTLGTPADMEEINQISARYSLPVIADAAAALGATYRGKPLGDSALLTVFSFNGNKTVTAGGGGIVAGNDEKLLNLARHLSTQARTGTEYCHDHRGFNYRLTNIQAAVGCAQMEQVESFIAAKRRLRGRYNSLLGGIGGVGTFPEPEWCASACWMSGVVIDGADIEKIGMIVDALSADGIQARSFWKPVHLQQPYLDVPRGELAESERIWDKILTLPCSTGLSDDEQDRVIAALTRILKDQ